MGLDFYLFKEGIKPLWEDPSNIKGGKWVLNLEKRRRGPENDKFWLELVISFIL
jgi:translation initiation factor 4E